MLLRHITTAIIGAGPVGLTMARLLQQHGAHVTVYEREEDPNARIWGGTLDLHKDSGQLALQQAGLLRHYYDLALPMGIRMADHLGNIHAVIEITPGNEHDNPEINRNDLRQLLLDSLQPNTVRWNHRITALQPHNGQWQLQSTGQPATTADLVIIANGGRSAIRKWVTDTEAEETGTFIIQGDVPDPQASCPEFYRLCDDKRLMTAHEGTLLVANPRNRDALTYGVIFKKPENWTTDRTPAFYDTQHIATFLSHRCSGWAPAYHQLFRATTAFVGLPTRRLPLGQPWTTDRPLPITLIGDAAHLMPPFAGQGVNTGLTDALTLSRNLTGTQFTTITAAINDYEQQMHRYAAEAQRQSSANEIILHQPGFSFQQFMQ